jgi:hypothetical protein
MATLVADDRANREQAANQRDKSQAGDHDDRQDVAACAPRRITALLLPALKNEPS